MPKRSAMTASAMVRALLIESSFSFQRVFLPSIEIRLARHRLENLISASLSLTRGTCTGVWTSAGEMPASSQSEKNIACPSWLELGSGMGGGGALG